MSIPMPTIEEYARAIRKPKNLALPVLRNLKIVYDAESNLPRAWPGAFGVVFRFENSDGAARAAKCFTHINRTHAERYEAISDHLDRIFCHNVPLTRFLVNSIYTRQGVHVDNKWHPLLLMDWVEGRFLHKYVASLIGEPDAKSRIAALAEQWVEVALALKDAGVAHGDLQHGNVLVEPSGNIKLIDYDGMCVPILANRFVMEGGHPNYQHPRRYNRFDENLDAFSALTILTALTALSLQPTLWNKYFRGNNLLFHKTDFRAPAASPLFADLGKIHDMKLACLTRELRAACAVRAISEIKPFEEIAAALQQ